jgi:hypothetical protein
LSFLCFSCPGTRKLPLAFLQLYMDRHLPFWFTTLFVLSETSRLYQLQSEQILCRKLKQCPGNYGLLSTCCMCCIGQDYCKFRYVPSIACAVLIYYEDSVIWKNVKKENILFANDISSLECWNILSAASRYCLTVFKL